MRCLVSIGPEAAMLIGDIEFTYQLAEALSRVGISACAPQR
jgi:hypothetical protein